MILARGNGWRARNTVKRAQVSRFVLVRRSSHLRHALYTASASTSACHSEG
jgi:hypothetical protein